MYWKDKKQAQVVRSLAKSQEEEGDWFQVPSAPTAVVFSSLAPPLRCQDGHFSLSSTWESQSLVVSEVHADLAAMGDKDDGFLIFHRNFVKKLDD